MGGEIMLQQPTVLIVADDVEFARAVMARWQTERSVPAFVLVSSEIWNHGSSTAFDIAIVNSPKGIFPQETLERAESLDKPVIFVCQDSSGLQVAREKFPKVLALRQHEGWPDALVLLGGEALRRAEAVNRAKQAEESAALSQREATLGRYMLEMRHSLNNALTSVLGNSELLLLEPGALSAQLREQVDTIRNMALRMHEIIQRFSSLESEMRCASQGQQQSRPNVKVFRAAAP